MLVETGCVVPAVAAAPRFAAGLPAAVGWRWRSAEELQAWPGSAALAVSAAKPAAATAGSTVEVAVAERAAGCAAAVQLAVASSCRLPRSLIGRQQYRQRSSRHPQNKSCDWAWL